jgi:hypothetical protein
MAKDKHGFNTRNRAGLLAHIDELYFELQRLSPHLNKIGLTSLEINDYRRALQPLQQWCNHHLNDKDDE